MNNINVIHVPGTPSEDAGKVHRNNLNRWEMMVALEFPVEDADITERFEGDTESDYADRAVSRFRKHLDALQEQGILKGYTIITGQREDESGKYSRATVICGADRAMARRVGGD